MREEDEKSGKIKTQTNQTRNEEDIRMMVKKKQVVTERPAGKQKNNKNTKSKL